ncbi:MAG: hypothetical protein EPN21_10260 [Methylococcaceae bacterium]|nr:MAG: hypothetical protein EPN21_10260 [Methylococcaceae bacterium]
MIPMRGGLFGYAAALLALTALALTLNGLAGVDFVRQSECRTAVVAREMLNSGDFLVPTVNGQPRFEKPPLYYWAIAALAGSGEQVSESTARLPSVLSALATALLLGGFAYRRAQRLGQPPFAAAVLAGLLLICLPGFWQRATLADAESLLALACLAVTFCLYEDLRQPRRHWLLAAYALSAVAFMVKGPVFLLFTWPAYWLGARAGCPRSQHLIGLLLFAVGASAWYAAVLWLEPHALEVFRHELAMRFDSREATHPQRWWFYFGQLFESTLPLGALLPLALYAAWQKRADKLEAFLLVNAAIAFIALTLLKTKQAHYLLPVLPWLALWLGDLAWSTGKRVERWVALVWLGLGGMLALALAVLAHGYGALALVPVFVLLALAAWPAARRLGDYPWRAVLLWSAALVVGGYAANEAVFKPLRGLKFEHSAYFEALRRLDGLSVAFNDACFYYYYGAAVRRSAAPEQNAEYLLTTDGTPSGTLRNQHRARQEWLWHQWKNEAVTLPLLTVEDAKLQEALVIPRGRGGFQPGGGMSKQTKHQTACLTTELWTGGTEAALLKVGIDGTCNALALLPDLLAANDLLQARLAPWKLLWLQAEPAPDGLQGWLVQQLLNRWVETNDAAVVLDRSALLSAGGKHATALLLKPGDFDGASLAVNNDVLELTDAAGASRRWQRRATGGRLEIRALPQ